MFFSRGRIWQDKFNTCLSCLQRKRNQILSANKSTDYAKLCQRWSQREVFVGPISNNSSFWLHNNLPNIHDWNKLGTNCSSRYVLICDIQFGVVFDRSKRCKHRRRVQVLHHDISGRRLVLLHNPDNCDSDDTQHWLRLQHFWNALRCIGDLIRYPI